MPGPCPSGQEIIDLYVKSRGKGVKGGVHAASNVDVATATPPFDARFMSPRRPVTASANTESTIYLLSARGAGSGRVEMTP